MTLSALSPAATATTLPAIVMALSALLIHYFCWIQQKRCRAVLQKGFKGKGLLSFFVIVAIILSRRASQVFVILLFVILLFSSVPAEGDERDCCCCFLPLLVGIQQKDCCLWLLLLYLLAVKKMTKNDSFWLPVIFASDEE